MAMCVQEEERIKAANGGTLSYVKDNKKKNVNANANSPSKPKDKAPMQHQFQKEQVHSEQRSVPVPPRVLLLLINMSCHHITSQSIHD
jgi:hypothetical protein